MPNFPKIRNTNKVKSGGISGESEIQKAIKREFISYTNES